MPPGAFGRACEALRHGDFRRLFGLRLASQCGDGLFQASLVASFVFAPERADTALRFALNRLKIDPEKDVKLVQHASADPISVLASPDRSRRTRTSRRNFEASRARSATRAWRAPSP